MAVRKSVRHSRGYGLRGALRCRIWRASFEETTATDTTTASHAPIKTRATKSIGNSTNKMGPNNGPATANAMSAVRSET